MKKFFLSVFFIISFLHARAQKEFYTVKIDEETRKYGIINLDRKWVQKPLFDQLSKLNDYFYLGKKSNSGKYVYHLNTESGELKKINYLLTDNHMYNHKFVIIQSFPKGPKGIMNIEGEVILPTFYSTLSIKDNYFIGEIDHQFFIYNFKGEKALPGSFKYIDIINEFIYVKTSDIRFPRDEKFIVYDAKLNLITQTDWTIEGKFGRDNLLLINTIDNQKFYIDRTGKIRIKPNSQLNYESPFSNGFAIVSSRNTPKKYGFIDTSGKVIIPLQYDEVGPFQTNYAFFEKRENGKLTQGLIDRHNRVVKIFPVPVANRSVYYDGNEVTYYLTNLETYDADGNFKEDKNLIQ